MITHFRAPIKWTMGIVGKFIVSKEFIILGDASMDYVIE